MGAFAGPEIAESGLVLALDAGNTKSYDKYENLYTFSEVFGGYWSTDGVTALTTNQGTSPNNDNTANKMVGPYIYRYFTSSGSPVPSGTTVTASVFVKNNGANTFNLALYTNGFTAGSTINLTTGTVTSGSAVITSYPNGWYRVSLTATTGSGNAYTAIEGLGGSGASQSLYIWGAQVEKSSIVSDYYSTTASTKSRGTTCTDLSGGGNTGTLTNGPTYNSANGGSIVFDGADDYISIPNSTSINPGTGSFSIVTWVNSDPSNGGDGWDLWVAKRSNGSNGYYLGVNNPLGAKFMVGNDANARTDTGYLTYTYNTWAMFTAILDRTANTQTVIKNNNVETSSVTPSGGNYSNTGALSIGGDIGINAYYVNGKVSYTQIYNKALTTAEVSQIYNATKGRYGL